MGFGERAARVRATPTDAINASNAESPTPVADTRDAINAIDAERPLARDGFAVCGCGERYYGVEGRPNLCPRCRRVRAGEPVPWWLARGPEQRRLLEAE